MGLLRATRLRVSIRLLTGTQTPLLCWDLTRNAHVLPVPFRGLSSTIDL